MVIQSGQNHYYGNIQQIAQSIFYEMQFAISKHDSNRLQQALQSLTAYQIPIGMIEQRRDEDGQGLIEKAVMDGFTKGVIELHKAGMDLSKIIFEEFLDDITPPCHANIFCAAAYNGNIELMEYLLSQYGRTILPPAFAPESGQDRYKSRKPAAQDWYDQHLQIDLFNFCGGKEGRPNKKEQGKTRIRLQKIKNGIRFLQGGQIPADGAKAINPQPAGHSSYARSKSGQYPIRTNSGTTPHPDRRPAQAPLHTYRDSRTH